jgi:hypothetical protein
VSSGVGVALIGQIIGHTRKCVNSMDVRAEFLGHEATDGKVFVVFSGQLAARGIRI